MLIKRKQLERIIKENPHEEMEKIYNRVSKKGCKGCLDNSAKKQMYKILLEDKAYRNKAMTTLNANKFFIFFKQENTKDKKLFCITKEQ